MPLTMPARSCRPPQVHSLPLPSSSQKPLTNTYTRDTHDIRSTTREVNFARGKKSNRKKFLRKREKHKKVSTKNDYRDLENSIPKLPRVHVYPHESILITTSQFHSSFLYNRAPIFFLRSFFLFPFAVTFDGQRAELAEHSEGQLRP